jgi:hypothetical protein
VRTPAVIAALAVVVATAVTAAPPPAEAAHGKDCRLVSKGSSDYRVRARVIGCASARKWARRWLRDRGRPGGYSCVDPAGSIRFYCSRGSRSYWGTRL